MLVVLSIAGSSCKQEETEWKVAADFASVFKIEVYADGLTNPTFLKFLPDGRLLVSELNDGIAVIPAGGGHPQRWAAATGPEADPLNPDDFPVSRPGNGSFQSGLMGLAVDPDFGSNAFVYAAHNYDRTPPCKACGAVNPYTKWGRLTRFTEVDGVGTMPTVLLDRAPAADAHQVQDVALLPDGTLLLAVGDAWARDDAPDLDRLNGKVLRINRDGTAPEDNPFFDPRSPDAPRSYVYSTGHRNPVGFAVTPEGSVLVVENGPIADDELNLVTPGGYSGWPSTWIAAGDPGELYSWTPIVSPTAVVMYVSDPGRPADFGSAFDRVLFVVTFGSETGLQSSGDNKKLLLMNTRGTGEALSVDGPPRHFLAGPPIAGEQPLGVVVGPDGALYVTVINFAGGPGTGRVHRISPAD